MKAITIRLDSSAESEFSCRRFRSAPRDVLIVSDGFSCREQILQETDRRALHLSQVLQMGLKEGPEGPIDGFPEQRYASPEKTGAVPVGILLAGSTLVGAGVWWALRCEKGTDIEIWE